MPPSLKLLLLQTGEAVGGVVRRRGGFVSLFEVALGEGRALALEVFDVTARREDDPLPELDDIDGVVMTGSPAMVGEDLPWMRFGARLIRHILDRGVPFLGVCFGHQLLGLALGADVGPNPKGREMGTVLVQLEGVGFDPLLATLPPRFFAQVSHVDVIRAPSLKLEVLGRATHDGCHVVRAGPLAWGVQFHPEFDDEVMRLYLGARASIVDNERGPGTAEARLVAVAPTPTARSLLPRFAAVCAARRTGDATEVRNAS